MTDNTVSENRLKKEKIVANLSEKVGKSKAIVLTNYQGLTHQQLESLKKALKQVDGEFVVTKNTLLKIALEAHKITPESTVFDQPTGTLFSYGDPILPLKELSKRIKESKLPEVKVGILDGLTISASDVLKLATLPSKEILLSQLVGTLKSPIFSLHRALNWNTQKLVMTLGAVAKVKPQA
jgi:large subunit ribosomal protein L10